MHRANEDRNALWPYTKSSTGVDPTLTSRPGFVFVAPVLTRSFIVRRSALVAIISWIAGLRHTHKLKNYAQGMQTVSEMQLAIFCFRKCVKIAGGLLSCYRATLRLAPHVSMWVYFGLSVPWCGNPV